MANDIANIVTGETTIRNGSVLVLTGRGTGRVYKRMDDFVEEAIQTPTIDTIQAKYDTRFDDPRYYQGDTAN